MLFKRSVYVAQMNERNTLLKYHIQIKSRSSYIATRGCTNKYFRKYNSLMWLVKHMKIFYC